MTFAVDVLARVPRRLVALAAAVAVILTGLIVAPTAARAEATLVTGIVVASPDGVAPAVPVGSGYQINASATNAEGYIMNGLTGATTDANGAFSMSIDFAANPTVKLILVPKADDAYGVTVYSLTAANAASYTNPSATWELKRANIVGVVKDVDNAASPVPGANVNLSYNGSPSTGIVGFSADSNGLFKVALDSFGAGVRLNVGPAYPASSTANGGVGRDYTLTQATGSVASPTAFPLTAITVSGILKASDNTTPLKSTQICLLESRNDGGWNGIDCRTTSADTGSFAFGVDFSSPKSYALRVESADPARGATTTWSLNSNTGLAGGYKNVSFALDPVTLFGVVRDANGDLLPGASVQVQKVDSDGTWLNGTGYGTSAAPVTAQVALNLDFGALSNGQKWLVIVGGPYDRTASGASIQASYATAPGTSQTWQLATPNVTATVYDAGNTPVALGDPLPRAQITVSEVNGGGNQVSFLGGQQADVNGGVQLRLDPAALETGNRYKVEVSGPYNQQTVGAATSFFFTKADLEATPSPYLGQTWKLSSPNVIGRVLDVDGTTPLENAWVSASALNAGGWIDQWLGSVRTGADGSFKLSVSEALLAADSYGLSLQVQLPFDYSGMGVAPTRRFVPGGTAIPYISEDLVLDTANAAVVVTGAGAPMQQSYVNLYSYLEVPGLSSMTNDSGVALFHLSSDTEAEILANTYTVNAQAPWNQRSDFAPVMVNESFTLDDPYMGLPTLRLVLPSPNLRMLVTEDGGAASAVLPFAGIEARNLSDPSSYSWNNSDSGGRVNMNLASGTWELTIRPPSNSGPDAPLVASRTYTVTVVGGAVTSVKDERNVDAPVASGRTVVGAASPTMKAKVTPVGGGWVEVVKIDPTTEEPIQWLQGSNARNDGKVGLNLANGTYRIIARAPWGSSAYSSSAPCIVTVTGGAVYVPETTCPTLAADDTFYELALRTPNLVATIVTPGGSPAPVPNANLCVIAARQWDCSQADSSGKVSLFVSSATDIEYEVMPPWNTNTYSSARDTIPIDQITGGQWEAADARTIALGTPNLAVTVTAGGQPVTSGWVSVGRPTPDGWEYIAGGNTASGGIARLNIPGFTADGEYCLEVWPGEVLSQTYSRNNDCGTPFAGATGSNPATVSVALSAANVSTYVTTADGLPNRWGSVLILQNGTVVGNAFLLSDGKMSAYLADGTYELVFFPGPGLTGATVTKTVRVAGGVSDLPNGVSLGSGNLSGTVTYASGEPVDGFVRAVNGPDIQTTPIGASGDFLLELTNGTWDVSVIDVNGGSASATVTVTGGTASPSSLTLEVN